MQRLLSFLFVVLILGSSTVAHGQNDTLKRVIVPGTDVVLSLPEGFTPATTFNGYIKGTDAVIMVSERKDDSYNVEATYLNPDSLTAKGARDVYVKEVTVAGYGGTLFSTLNKRNQRTYTLLFGDNTFCAVITVLCRANDAAMGAQLRQVLLDCGYTRPPAAGPTGATWFTMATGSTGYRLSRAADGEYLYTKDSVLFDNFHDAYILVAQIDLPPGGTAKSVCITPRTGPLLHWAPVKYAKQGHPLAINGNEAYWEEIQQTEFDIPVSYYQVVIVSGKKALTIQSKSPTASKPEMAVMKQLIETIRFKRD